QTRRDGLARSTAGDLGVTDLGARRRRAGALVERVDGGFTAALCERRQLRLGQRRRLDEPLIERLVERTVATAAAHEREHPAGAIRFLAAALLVPCHDLVDGLATAALGQQRLERALRLRVVERHRAGIL